MSEIINIKDFSVFNGGPTLSESFNQDLKDGFIGKDLSNIAEIEEIEEKKEYDIEIKMSKGMFTIERPKDVEQRTPKIEDYLFVSYKRASEIL